MANQTKSGEGAQAPDAKQSAAPFPGLVNSEDALLKSLQDCKALLNAQSIGANDVALLALCRAIKPLLKEAAWATPLYQELRALHGLGCNASQLRQWAEKPTVQAKATIEV